jgi:hypothetical protein
VVGWVADVDTVVVVSSVETLVELCEVVDCCEVVSVTGCMIVADGEVELNTVGVADVADSEDVVRGEVAVETTWVAVVADIDTVVSVASVEALVELSAVVECDGLVSADTCVVGKVDRVELETGGVDAVADDVAVVVARTVVVSSSWVDNVVGESVADLEVVTGDSFVVAVVESGAIVVCAGVEEVNTSVVGSDEVAELAAVGVVDGCCCVVVVAVTEAVVSSCFEMVVSVCVADVDTVVGVSRGIEGLVEAGAAVD